MAIGIGLLAMGPGASRALAQGQGASKLNPPPRLDGEREAILKTVRLEQKLGNQVPLDARFRDETGKYIRLGDYYGKKPVMFMLLQYRCTMLCQEQMNILMGSLNELEFTPGKQFELVVVSIDPREDPEIAADQKRAHLARYAHPETAAGWHYLTGDKKNIDLLSDALGFYYVYDAHTDQYAHPDGVMTTTAEGKIARYHFSLDYRARDLKFGLIEATQKRIGSAIDLIALLCYHYNPKSGTYGLSVLNTMRVAAAATVLGLLFGIGGMKLRERVGARPRAGRSMGMEG
jgi:protein SCO1